MRDFCQTLRRAGNALLRECSFPPGIASRLRRDGLVVSVEGDPAQPTGEAAVYGLAASSLTSVSASWGGQRERRARLSKRLALSIPRTPERLLDDVEGASRSELVSLPPSISIRGFVVGLPAPGKRSRPVAITAGFSDGDVVELERPAPAQVSTEATP